MSAQTSNVTGTFQHVVRVRLAVLPDANEMSRLLTQLGHPTTTAEIIDRWPQWEAEGNSALVATSSVNADDTTLVGLCTLHQMRVLHRPRPVGRITALVVDETVRGEGIGRMLVSAAEDLFARNGCGLLEVTSNLKLEDAHRFYEILGYEKSSVRLVRTIAK